MLRDFVANEVEPQAREHDRNESLNLPLLRQLGDLGLLGLTVAEDYGGSGLDAAAVALVHEELSYSDPGLCLSYLAHSLLLVNNIHANGSPEQKERFLPRAVRGEHLGGMGMSEASAGACGGVFVCVSVCLFVCLSVVVVALSLSLAMEFVCLVFLVPH